MADIKSFKFISNYNFFKNSAILLFSIIFAFTFGWVNYSIHENRLWFSNIEEVEREISFRTECGFYYSYYKQLILNRTYASPYSILTSISSLTNDHLTESPRVINVIKRFNILQEILFSFIYSFLEYCLDVFKNLNYFKNFLVLPEPIIFYVYLCFGFSSLGIFAIFWLTINVISTFEKIYNYKKFVLKYKEFEWTFGILAASWAFANLEDITRVYFTVNLRENFALPIFWIQNYFILNSLRQLKIEHLQIFKDMFFIAFFTFLFSAFWQFNQFLLFFQSVSLFLTYLVYSASNSKFEPLNNCHVLFNINPDIYYFLNIKKILIRILFAQTFGFLLLIPIQGFQPMLLTSYFVKFNIAIIITIIFFDSILQFQNQIFKTLIKIIFVLLLTIFLNIISKFFLDFHADDSHIWTFLNSKLRQIFSFFQNNNFLLDKSYFITDLIDLPFESAIYICHGAFAFIDKNFFIRTLKTGILPMYLISIIIILYKASKKFFSLNSISLITENFNLNKEFDKKNKINASAETFSNLNNLKSIQNNQINNFLNVLNPILLFFALQSIASGFLAILMMRMIYLWLPQMIVLAAYGVKCLLNKFFEKNKQNIIILTFSFILLAYRGELFRQEMLNEQVFLFLIINNKNLFIFLGIL